MAATGALLSPQITSAGAPHPADLVLHATNMDFTTPAPTPVATAPAVPASGPGAVDGFGNAPVLGAPGPTAVAPTVGLARTPSGAGYWVATSDGGVFAYGDAAFHGSLGNQRLAAPIVGLTATPDGGGYWLVASDGGVFAFGDATFRGSLGGRALDSPIVGISATPTGGGYTLAAADGGVFSFGDADFTGSLGGSRLVKPIVGIAATGTGKGYWLAASDGGVFSFGDATFHGSLAGEALAGSITAIAPSPTGDGYWLAGKDGGVFAFGDALYSGALSPLRSGTAVVALAPGKNAGSYWTATASTSAGTQAAGASTGISLGSFLITCYDLGGTTATGTRTSLSSVAVDPSVIPLGSTISIAGVGTRVAEDTGSAIRGHRLDLWLPSASACASWGAQTREVSRIS